MWWLICEVFLVVLFLRSKKLFLFGHCKLFRWKSHDREWIVPFDHQKLDFYDSLTPFSLSVRFCQGLSFQVEYFQSIICIIKKHKTMPRVWWSAKRFHPSEGRIFDSLITIHSLIGINYLSFFNSSTFPLPHWIITTKKKRIFVWKQKVRSNKKTLWE